jgi:5-methylthioribose kinase
LDRNLTARFTGIEIMRRLIGVAQLPLGYGLDRKKELLELSQALVLESGGE